MIGQTPEGEPAVHLTILSSVSAEYLPLARMTAPNKLAYAMRWGFALTFGRYFKRDYDIWGCRQVQIMHTLSTTDWLWFMGADTVITNMTIDARAFCDPNAHGVIALDVNGINNDSWFLRNCPESFRFMEDLLALRGNKFAPNDQEAMKIVLARESGFKMSYVSQRLFNAYLYGEGEYASYDDNQKNSRGGSWQHGDFVVHFAGIDLPKRMRLTQQLLGAVVE
jgi:hypothetical protein